MQLWNGLIHVSRFVCTGLGKSVQLGVSRSVGLDGSVLKRAGGLSRLDAGGGESVCVCVCVSKRGLGCQKVVGILYMEQGSREYAIVMCVCVCVTCCRCAV